ncbi:hypothetical protein RclHR1_08420001 [Rhizophagus clarus]|uniref:Uncharacterized protein n=1 Tax=Rhizophagus clarus TaxID=94130 RepID=A0A2Z6SN40_9GLOM|nr:hypothetical protein RclHR1_08420001 [Rhizophagus clarus]
MARETFRALKHHPTEEPIEPPSRDINYHNQNSPERLIINQKSRAKKQKSKPITAAFSPDKGKNNDHQPLQNTATLTAEIQATTQDSMEDVIIIKLIVNDQIEKNEEDSPMDIDLIGLHSTIIKSNDSSNHNNNYRNPLHNGVKIIAN